VLRVKSNIALSALHLDNGGENGDETRGRDMICGAPITSGNLIRCVVRRA